MNKSQQRIILIVAVVICGLTYVLQSWKQNPPPQALDTASREMRLAVQDGAVRETLQSSKKYWLLTLARTADDPITTVQHKVMGGLGSQVLAVQFVLYDHEGRSEWLQNYHEHYSNITQFLPPKDEIPALLKSLRACQGDCQNRGRFLYLIDPEDFAVRYYGEQHWSVLALVQDIQNRLPVQ